MKLFRGQVKAGFALPYWFIVLLWLAPMAALAQFSGSVQGTLTDLQRATVANASVTLHNVDTGVDQTQRSSSSGSYRFSEVAPGNYALQVSATGFKPESVTFTVTTGETRGVDIALSVGSTDVKVTVEAVASALNPEETRLQTTVSATEISQLPLASRDVQKLIALTPGVTGFQNPSPSAGYGASLFAGSFNPPYHANGLSTGSNLFLIDDLPVNDAITQGGALILPNSEMISQVSLQSQTYSVDNGTSASIQTAFTTKSGTNKFHGSVDYGYDSANIASAKDPVSQKVAPFHQNLLLASLGGPIFRDKTFFFGSIEKQNAAIGGASSVTPYFTPQFAQWALNAFPNSGAAKGLIFAPPTRDTGGVVKLASDYYPSTCGTTQTVPSDATLSYNLPCDTPVYVTGAFLSQAQPFNGIQWNVRLDHSFNSGKDRIYGLYERIDQTLGNLSERPKLDAVTPSQNKYFSVNYVHVFGSRLVNEAHLGNLRVIGGSKLGDPRATSIPYLPILLDSAAGFQFTFPFGTTPFGAQTNKEHTYALRDTVSYMAGKHNLRAGYQFYRADTFQDSSQIYTRPFVPFYLTDTFSWVSNTAQTSYSLYTIGGDGKYKPQYYGASSRYNSVFVDDNWKVLQNLTLTLGLRYDHFGNPVSYGDTAQPFVAMFPGRGTSFSEQAWNTSTKPVSQAFTQGQNLNFLPRAGFAYTPTRNKLTLLRGGIGLYENVLTPFQIAANLPTLPPNRISLSPYGVVPYGDFQTTSAPFGYNYSYPTYGSDPYGNIYSNPAKTAVFSANLNGFVPELKPEKIINFSAGLEQQFGANLVLGINYAGSHGMDLVYGSASGSGANADYNLKVGSPKARPTSEWGVLNYGRNGLSSNYNALIVTLRQNYKGLSYQANYNWSRALQYAPTTNTQSATYTIWKGIYDPKSYYGPSSFDVPNSFSFAGTYEVPKLLENKLADQAVSGWRVGTFIVAQSGTPFTVVRPGVDYQNDGSANFDGNNGTPGFPNYTGATRRGFDRSKALSGVLSASQFTDPVGVGTTTVTSTQGANTFRNLGYFDVDASLAKAFNFTVPSRETGFKLVLRGEAINLLNRTNWQGFVSDLTNTGSFGKVLSANQKRYLQIGGRLEF